MGSIIIPTCFSIALRRLLVDETCAVPRIAAESVLQFKSVDETCAAPRIAGDRVLQLDIVGKTRVRRQRHGSKDVSRVGTKSSRIADLLELLSGCRRRASSEAATPSHAAVVDGGGHHQRDDCKAHDNNSERSSTKEHGRVAMQ